MNAPFSIVRTAFRLGPVAITWFIVMIYLMDGGLEVGVVLPVFFFGTVICWIISFFAGLIFFGALAALHQVRPMGTNQIQIFERGLPLFIFGFGSLVAWSCSNDRRIIDNLSEDASVRIYDRHGTIIFSSDDGYAHPRDGHLPWQFTARRILIISDPGWTAYIRGYRTPIGKMHIHPSEDGLNQGKSASNHLLDVSRIDFSVFRIGSQVPMLTSLMQSFNVTYL